MAKFWRKCEAEFIWYWEEYWGVALLGETTAIHSPFFIPSPDKLYCLQDPDYTGSSVLSQSRLFHHYHLLPVLPKAWCQPLLPWQSVERVGTCQKGGGEGQKMSRRCCVLKAMLNLHTLYTLDTQAERGESRIRTGRTVVKSLTASEMFLTDVTS